MTQHDIHCLYTLIVSVITQYPKNSPQSAMLSLDLSSVIYMSKSSLPSSSRRSRSSASLSCLERIAARLALTSASLLKLVFDLTALSPLAFCLARRAADECDLPGVRAGDDVTRGELGIPGSLGPIGFTRGLRPDVELGGGTLKLVSKLAREDARPNGRVVANPALVMVGAFSLPGGLTVACLRANELAVGAYNVEERLDETDVFTPSGFAAPWAKPAGGAGAGRALRIMSA